MVEHTLAVGVFCDKLWGHFNGDNFCGGGKRYEFGSNGKNEWWKRGLRERARKKLYKYIPVVTAILGRLPNSQHSA